MAEENRRKIGKTITPNWVHGIEKHFHCQQTNHWQQFAVDFIKKFPNFNMLVAEMEGKPTPDSKFAIEKSQKKKNKTKTK